MTLGLVLLMGGSGSRFGGDVPKQFMLLQNLPVYLHTLQIFQGLKLFDEIVLVCHEDWIPTVRQQAPNTTIIHGGSTRQESSYLGLKGFQSPPEIVMIHDAVRPFVSEKIIKDNIEQAKIHRAVDTCIPTADTIVHSVNGKTIDQIPKRDAFLRGQTPQTFHFQLIVDAHEAARKTGILSASDDCQLVLQRGIPVHIVLGSEENIKITTSFDLLIYQTLTSNYI